MRSFPKIIIAVQSQKSNSANRQRFHSSFVHDVHVGSHIAKSAKIRGFCPFWQIRQPVPALFPAWSKNVYIITKMNDFNLCGPVFDPCEFLPFDQSFAKTLFKKNQEARRYPLRLYSRKASTGVMPAAREAGTTPKNKPMPMATATTVAMSPPWALA